MKILTFLVLLLCLGCNQEQKQLRITTVTISYISADNIKYDTITSVVKDEYFSVSLYQSYFDSLFVARKVVYDKARYNKRFYDIVDESGGVIGFNGSNQFLNFMSECGYEMKDRDLIGSIEDYTFKRK